MSQGIEVEDNVTACGGMGVSLAGGDGWLLCRVLTSEFEIFFPILKAILGDGTPVGGKRAFLKCFFNMFELKSITMVGWGSLAGCALSVASFWSSKRPLLVNGTSEKHLWRRCFG